MDYLETDELFNEFNLLKTAMRTLKERYMSFRTVQADKDRLKINIRDTITVTRQQTILTLIFPCISHRYPTDDLIDGKIFAPVVSKMRARFSRRSL